MRFQLKQVLPMALLFSGVLAATKSNTDEATTDAASTEATATDDSASATATATDESTATGTNDSSATGTDDSTITTEASQTTATEPTLTWVATTAATTAPDLLSNDGFSLKDNNYIVVSLSVSLLTAAMTFL